MGNLMDQTVEKKKDMYTDKGIHNAHLLEIFCPDCWLMCTLVHILVNTSHPSLRGPLCRENRLESSSEETQPPFEVL